MKPMFKWLAGIVAGASLLAGGHYFARHLEANKLARAQQEIVWAEQAQEKVKNYFSDGVINEQESRDLYNTSEHPRRSGTLRDLLLLSTHEGVRLNYELFNINSHFPHWVETEIPVDERNKKLVALLGDYTSYLQSEECRDVLKPLNVRERAGRCFAFFMEY